MNKLENILDRTDRWLEDNRKWLFGLAALVFALKAFYILQSAGSLQNSVLIMDAKYYDDTARDILGGNVLRREAFFMGPLYPYFLAMVYGVVGRDFTVLRLIQAAGGTVTVVLTYLLGRRLFRPVTGLAGALVLTFYGAVTFYETQVLMMWMGALLNVWLLLLLVRIEPGAGWRAYILPGIVLGVSALARANVLLFLPVVLVWLLFVGDVTARRRKAAAFAAAVIVAILPATIHNFAVSRDFVPVTSNAGVNFYIGNSENATGIFYPPGDTDFVTDPTTRRYVERLLGRDLSPSQLSSYWFDRAFEFIRDNPGAEIRLLWRKTAMFFNAYETPQIESYDLARERHFSLRLLGVSFWFVVSFGLLGLIYSFSRWRTHFLLHGYILSFALSIILFFITARYRVQIAPVLAMFAAHALVTVLPARLANVRHGFAVGGLLFLLLLVTQPRLFAMDPDQVNFRESVHEARRASSAGRYPYAVEEIDRAIAIYPDYFEGYVHRAIIHKAGKNLFKAIEDYSRALDLNPVLPGTRYDLGQAFRQVNLRSEAVEQYRKAIELDPLMIKAHNNLGITYAEMRRFDDAVASFERVIEMDPNYVKAYNNLGAVYAQSGRVEESVIVFRKAIERAPEYASSYKNLANAYISQKQVGPAIEVLELYLELEPDDETARENLRKLHIAARSDSL
jgi:Tfp pilus assembly protein PilF